MEKKREERSSWRNTPLQSERLRETWLICPGSPIARDLPLPLAEATKSVWADWALPGFA